MLPATACLPFSPEIDPLRGREPGDVFSLDYAEERKLCMSNTHGSVIRLINTTTLEMKTFRVHVPHYAILSHTWGDDEVTHQEWPTLNSLPILRSGYRKIVDACKMARQKDLEWLWADTCCIDKTSSAELAEAINSMYAWYAASEVCLAYLSDVQSTPYGYNGEQLRQSRWFTRGWTLQELLAPREGHFYDERWGLIGTKSSKTTGVEDALRLPNDISQTTGIDVQYIIGRRALSHSCVAEKMSWLARRTTTRQEDIAYCAMGIFDVNMPLLYGEGKKAFMRLQEEIIKNTHEQSIFLLGARFSCVHNLGQPTCTVSQRLSALCQHLAICGVSET